MPFYIIVILISFIASIIGLSLKENRIPVLVSFSYFLLLSFVIEYIAWSLSRRFITNTILYNYFTAFEFIFYLFFFWSVFTGSRMKKIILAVIIFYILCAVLNINFIQKGVFHSYTYNLGSMLIVIFSITYFYFLFRFPEKNSLTKNPFFWIGIALLFYYTCTFFIYGLQNFITITIKNYNTILTRIEDFLNIVLYTLFSIGFLCKIKFRKLFGL
jgi:hypothetical protein